jgi:hypothetical protein
MTPVDSRTLVKELAGETCRCGKTKRRAQTFCRACYFSLPRPMQLALYRHVGAGYEQAYMNAAIYLETLRMERS